MSDAEPIISKTPPESINPSKSTPSPEGPPEKGIKVECRQPELLYLIARKIIDGEIKDSILELSMTKFNDIIFNEEITRLFVHKPSKFWREEERFSLSTILFLSKEKMNREDSGYFSNEKVNKINDALTRVGMKTKLDQKISNQNRIVIEENGFFIEVFFGYPSAKVEEEQVMREVEEEKKLGMGEEGIVTKYLLPRIEEVKIMGGLKN